MQIHFVVSSVQRVRTCCPYISKYQFQGFVQAKFKTVSQSRERERERERERGHGSNIEFYDPFNNISVTSTRQLDV